MPPMTPEGERRTAAIPKTWYYDNDGGGPFNAPTDLSAYDRCITRGAIGSMLPVGYNAGNEIVQAPGYVALRNEMIHETRIIRLDGRPHVSSVIRQYMGDSVGRWDGDTLVVETNNLRGAEDGPHDGGLDVNGSPYSQQAKFTERIRRLSYGHLQIDMTVDDPKSYTKPWTVRVDQRILPDSEMIEFICNENQQFRRRIKID